MASLFEAYITNLGKYNEGELVGETLKFPTTTEEVQALLKRIGVDGVRYEEFFIVQYFWSQYPRASNTINVPRKTRLQDKWEFAWYPPAVVRRGMNATRKIRPSTGWKSKIEISKTDRTLTKPDRTSSIP